MLSTLTFIVWNIIQFRPASTVNTHASFALLLTYMLLAVTLLDRVSPSLARGVCYVNMGLTALIWVLPLPGPF